MKRIADALGINRIRLEFKGFCRSASWFIVGVLIESDWNLKPFRIARLAFPASVLIESDWNLKYSVPSM